MPKQPAIHAKGDLTDATRDRMDIYKTIIAKVRDGDVVPAGTVQLDTYEFELHQHLGASTVLAQRLVAPTDDGAIDGVQAADTDPSVGTRDTLAEYSAVAARVSAHAPDPVLDLTQGSPYGVYNWELFFHVPLTIAIQLSKSGRYAEARRWLHYIFDPTDQSTEPGTARYWKFQAFKQTDVTMIETRLANLDKDPALRDAIQDWGNHPFSPHAAARVQPVAYMLKTVMTYLDNLIQWGDSLFREDTRESINDALQLYILAAKLLGERPQASPFGARRVPVTFEQVKDQLDAFRNTSVELEPELPFDTGPEPTPKTTNSRFGAVQTVTRTLFCIPHNDRLLTYWDTVADRLFKIRNSLNLQGVFRQLPLFPPPIDPALLAAAAAAGLDVAAIASGALQPLPIVRYTVLAQKANELAQEVRSMAAQLLSTLEKIDGERLAILRANQEAQLLGMQEVVKYGQYQDAIKAREGLEQGLVIATERYRYYERLLGKQKAELQPPEFKDLDTEALDRLALSASEPTIAPREITIDSSLGPPPPAGGSSPSPLPLPPVPEGAPAPPTPPAPPDPLGLLDTPELDFGSHLLSAPEKDEISRLEQAQQHTGKASSAEIIGAFMNIIPSFSVDLTPLGLGTTVSFGGFNIAAIFSGIAATERALAQQQTYHATMAAKLDTYARREMEWAFQSNLAAGEVQQAYKQLRAAQIREAVAERDWNNHKQQIKNAEEIATFLTDDRKGKTTNQAFYARIKAELRGLHTRAFDLAYEVGAKAERALQFELGDPSLRFLAPTYLAGNEGLLAGDKLVADLKRMEVAYLERNARELEMTKQVSLLALAPRALLDLRATGKCTLRLPETLFDMDGPGHYFRRLKSVSMTIPCVAGPYTSVACKLTLLKSSIRISNVGDSYPRTPDDDDRFVDYFGSSESIVTSTAVNDAGMFEVNLRDERYLPFEGRGAISEWALELPAIKSFDRESITDVILNVRYTARDGGSVLGTAATETATAAIATAATVGSVRMFSIRHEFPSEWARFKAAPASAAGYTPLTFDLTLGHYPFWRREIADADLAIRGVELYVRADATTDVAADAAGTQHDPLPKVETRLFGGEIPKTAAALPGLAGRVTLHLHSTALDDVFLAVAWGSKSA